ncbi:hypothetical protein F4604DRAFT_1838876 [Suillus subluteus]|nr:hypothetical protein F4604DRAFT_1838876 [Suillus subluteus]
MQLDLKVKTLYPTTCPSLSSHHNVNIDVVDYGLGRSTSSCCIIVAMALRLLRRVGRRPSDGFMEYDRGQRISRWSSCVCRSISGIVCVRIFPSHLLLQILNVNSNITLNFSFGALVVVLYLAFVRLSLYGYLEVRGQLERPVRSYIFNYRLTRG